MDLRGKTILITGAGRGLGAAMAKRLAARGANLALLDRDAAGLGEVRDACRTFGVRAETYAANVAAERDVRFVPLRKSNRYGHRAVTR